MDSISFGSHVHQSLSRVRDPYDWLAHEVFSATHAKRALASGDGATFVVGDLQLKSDDLAGLVRDTFKRTDFSSPEDRAVFTNIVQAAVDEDNAHAY